MRSSHTAFGIGLVLLLLLCAFSVAMAETPVDFPGTVVMVDAAAGKLAVKKDQGGTRFTFVASDKTQFAGVAGLKDLKQGDHVTVGYVMKGSQYLAQKIAKK